MKHGAKLCTFVYFLASLSSLSYVFCFIVLHIFVGRWWLLANNEWLKYKNWHKIYTFFLPWFTHSLTLSWSLHRPSIHHSASLWFGVLPKEPMETLKNNEAQTSRNENKEYHCKQYIFDSCMWNTMKYKLSAHVIFYSHCAIAKLSFCVYVLCLFFFIVFFLFIQNILMIHNMLLYVLTDCVHCANATNKYGRYGIVNSNTY